MADIELKIGGDPSGAKEALDETAEVTKRAGKEAEATEKALKQMGKAIAGAAAAAAVFSVAAVKAWSDSEKQQRQLTRAAGEYAKELSEQAEAMSRLYAVDDDVIKQSQTLLAQWGGVGAASESVTKAILDYAAATGTDAVGATNDLIKQVETGGAGLRKLGVDFTATGDRGKDLAAAVEAISKKFGGAAEADSAGLNGQAHRAKLAFDDLTKAWGGMVGSMAEKSGVLDGVAARLRELTDAVFTPEAEKKAQSKEFWLEQKRIYEEGLSGRLTLYKDFANGVVMTWEEMQSELVKIEANLRPEWQDKLASGGKPSKATGKTSASESIAAKEQAERLKELADQRQKAFRDDLKAEEMHELEQADRRRDKYAKELADSAKSAEDRKKLEAEVRKDRDAIRVEEEKKSAAHAEKIADDEVKAQEDAAKKLAEIEKKKSDQARAVGDAIGAAFVNGLTEQLARLAQGEELDPAMFVGEILAATVATAAAVIGSVYGMPAVGAAVGNLAALGIRAGASAISGSNKKRKTFHSGGWVEPDDQTPRYHGGLMPGEVPAILQPGEGVLSRADVASMGGRPGVERAKRGGGSVVVNVSALDAKSAAESFVTDVGRGMRRALRSGQGDLPSLLPAFGR